MHWYQLFFDNCNRKVDSLSQKWYILCSGLYLKDQMSRSWASKCISAQKRSPKAAQPCLGTIWQLPNSTFPFSCRYKHEFKLHTVQLRCVAFIAIGIVASRANDSGCSWYVPIKEGQFPYYYYNLGFFGTCFSPKSYIWFQSCFLKLALAWPLLFLTLVDEKTSVSLTPFSPSWLRLLKVMVGSAATS